MKYCINCGEKIEDGVDFCVKCGHKQSDPIVISSHVSLVEKLDQEKRKVKKKKYSTDEIIDAIGCIIIIGAIINFIILFAFFKDWLVFLWPFIIAIILISCIIRLIGAGIVELIQRSKEKKHKGNDSSSVNF